MKFKKTASFILSILMTFSIPLTAFSDAQPLPENQDSKDKDLENAISSAKKLINIPEEYSEFSYSYHNNEGENLTYWELNWTTKDNENKIQIDIDNNGNIIIYHDYNYSSPEKTPKLANITTEQAEKTAENFLDKVILKNRKLFKKVDIPNRSENESYEFAYQFFINNIPVERSTIYISVNKYNGKVTYYNAFSYNSKHSDIAEVTPSINKNDAKKLFIDNIGIKLNYYSNYDYQTKKLNIFPAYTIADYSKAINAVTGDTANLYNSYNNLYKYSKDEAAAVADSGSQSARNLSKEEIKEINNISGIISKNEALNIIKRYAKYSNIENEAYKEVTSSLYKNTIGNNNYIWIISFGQGYGTVDASTGELLSFSISNYPVISTAKYSNEEINNKNANTISYEDAKKKAETFLNEVSSDKFNQVKLNDNKKNNDENENYYFTYVRQVNGIDFLSNYSNVVINKKTGVIFNYENVWYSNINFPDIKNVISESDAFDLISNSTNFGLIYDLTSENNFSLVYKFIDAYDNYLINPFTGKRINYDGKDYIENLKPSYYSDISGHWCEDIVKELLQNNYYLEGNKFNPDENITLINFFKYMESSHSYNVSDEELYKRLIESKIIDKNEKADSFVTRQDTAKYITRRLEYEDIASKTSIFNNVFKDDITENYKGYAAICYALNIITGDKENNFNGEEYITNAESAQIIYNLISNTDFR